ncbi:MAG: hypothetical protein M3478_09720 [Planctomycetota bacterium]|nr:hypothetical protein [Planctomycetota bacterium]
MRTSPIDYGTTPVRVLLGAKAKRILKWGGGALALGVLLIAIAGWYFLPLDPMFDDGPFQGTAASAVNDRAPDQSTPIWGGRTLEVFDPRAAGVSPTVQLRRADGSIQWAILADGDEPGDVSSVRFTRVHRGVTRTGTVYGTVRWTYGHEGATWFITGGGDLRGYWYSW